MTLLIRGFNDRKGSFRDPQTFFKIGFEIGLYPQLSKLTSKFLINFGIDLGDIFQPAYSTTTNEKFFH